MSVVHISRIAHGTVTGRAKKSRVAISALGALAVVASTLIGALGVATAAGAATTNPKIAHLAASPATVTMKNGSVTISATVTNASTCTLSSPTVIAGLPASSSCGAISTTVVLPASSSAKTYAITLKAQGSSATKSKTIDVKVAAGAGQPALTGATALASTDFGYCAVVTTASVTGGVDCWAGNPGQSGTGSDTANLTATAVRSPLPGNVGLLTGVTSLVGAGTEYCAVYSSAGNVACWGSDQWVNNVWFPVTVISSGGGDVSSIESVVGTLADPDTFCGLTSGQEVWCWGSNYTSNTFGDGTTSSNATWNTATLVVNTSDTGPLTQVSALFAGGSDSLCAIVTSAANLDCWGQNVDGQLGNGSTTATTSPVEVHGLGNSGVLSGVTGANGDGSTWCAIYSSGHDAACWGLNTDANLGDGTQSGAVDAPVAVSAPVGGGSGSFDGVRSLGNGGFGSCAVLTSGGIDCWGFGNFGVVGNGNDVTGSLIPSPVFGVGGAGTLGGVAAVTGSQAGRARQLLRGTHEQASRLLGSGLRGRAGQRLGWVVHV